MLSREGLGVRVYTTSPSLNPVVPSTVLLPPLGPESSVSLVPLTLVCCGGVITVQRHNFPTTTPVHLLVTTLQIPHGAPFSKLPGSSYAKPPTPNSPLPKGISLLGGCTIHLLGGQLVSSLQDSVSVFPSERCLVIKNISLLQSLEGKEGAEVSSIPRV